MSKTKFFRVAVEGATTDGRVIERAWIQDMGGNYNPATYGARINMEHIRGFSDQPPFCAYGDILATKAEEIDIEINGAPVKRLALFVQIAPNEYLLKANRAGQKVYTSIEVNPNFAGTGKAYLMGLALTDNPASLGTEMLEFVAKTPDLKAEYDRRKQHKDNLFTAAVETMFELEAEGEQQPSEGGFAAAFASLLQRFGMAPAAPTGGGSPPAPAITAAPGAPSTPPGAGGEQKDFASAAAMLAFAQTFETALKAQGDTFKAEMQILRQDLSTVTTKLSSTGDGSPSRPESTGGSGQVMADC